MAKFVFPSSREKKAGRLCTAFRISPRSNSMMAKSPRTLSILMFQPRSSIRSSPSTQPVLWRLLAFRGGRLSSGRVEGPHALPRAGTLLRREDLLDSAPTVTDQARLWQGC